MRILVTGSRDWTDREKIRDLLLLYSGGRGTVLVHGACRRGADRIADEIAYDWPWIVERHPAAWNALGKAAGYRRNEEMARLGADICLAFQKGGSRGTQHMIDLAEQYRIRKVVTRAE